MKIGKKKAIKFILSKVGVMLFGLAGVVNVHALTALDDSVLSQIDAQDGVITELTFGPDSSSSPGVGVKVDRLYWEDNAGMVQGSSSSGTNGVLRAYSENITLYGKGMGLTMKLDTGTYNGKAGLNLDVLANIGTAFGRAFRACDNTNSNWQDGCGASLGALTIQTNSPLHFNLQTSDGLFSQSALAYLRSDIRNVNVYWNQAVNASSPDTSTNNQFVLKNFNFNFEGVGYAFITDAGGLALQTACPPSVTCTTPGRTPMMTLLRVTDPSYASKTLPGLNLEMMYKAASGTPTDATTYIAPTTGGLIHLGLSGELSNAALIIRGTQIGTVTGGGDASIFGNAYSAAGNASTQQILGSSGLALSFGADFKRDGDNPVTLELGHAGNNAFGVQFGNLSPLQVRTGCAADGTGCTSLNGALASFTSGQVYVDLTASKKLLMPKNGVLQAIPMGGGCATAGGAGCLTQDAEYSVTTHNLASNPAMMAMAVRGMNFNAISRNSRFVVSNDVTDATVPAVKNAGDMSDFYSGGAWAFADKSWGLGLPFYNVNVASALYGVVDAAHGNEERIGLGFALSTTGRDGVYNSTTPASSTATTRTTSILLIDGAPNSNDSNNPTNYYVGLRNIDMYMAGQGSIGLNGDSSITSSKGLNLDIKSFTLALSAEVAAGYLPGSKFRTGSQYAPSNSFTLKDDVLSGLRLKMAGSTNLVITPGSSTSLEASGKASNFPRLLGTLNLSGGALQFVEPVDGTILGLDNICGGSAGGAAVATYYASPCSQGSTAAAVVKLDNFIRINRDSVDFGYSLNFNPNNIDANVFRIKSVEMFPNGDGSQQRRLGEMVITGGTLNTMLSLKPR